MNKSYYYKQHITKYFEDLIKVSIVIDSQNCPCCNYPIKK